MAMHEYIGFTLVLYDSTLTKQAQNIWLQEFTVY